MTRTTRLLTIAAAVTLALALPAAARAGVTLSITPEVTADDRLVWNADYMIRNTDTVGFFADSLFLDFVNEDEGETGRPRRWTEPFHALLKTLAPVSGGDSLPSSLLIPARFERGSFTLRMYGHNSAGLVGPLTATTRLLPGPVSTAYPSKLVKAGKATVELVAMAPENAAGKSPGVLLVHDDGEHARRLMAFALTLRTRGYGVVLVSLPGAGTSTGPADLGGAATRAALDLAWSELAKLPGVDPARLAAVGTGPGATAAALLASRQPGVRALALLGATFDLQAAHRSADAGARAAIVTAAGRDSAGWKARSPLAQPLPKCATLVLHGDRDTVAPVASAQEYAARLQAAGVKAELKLQKDRGHELSPAFARQALMAFLKAELGS